MVVVIWPFPAVVTGFAVMAVVPFVVTWWALKILAWSLLITASVTYSVAVAVRGAARGGAGTGRMGRHASGMNRYWPLRASTARHGAR